jgi:hypothetical protein
MRRCSSGTRRVSARRGWAGEKARTLRLNGPPLNKDDQELECATLRALGESRVSARLGGRVRKLPSAYATRARLFAQLLCGKGKK